jgi:phosphatidylserine/phosphatidylglycerophosphate/cardiolipin synthase-like enzyme
VDFVEPRRPIVAEFVGGRGHYDHVVRAVMAAERSVWIATANLKELMVEDHRAAPGRRRTTRVGAQGARSYRSIIAVFDELAARGIELRILHASPPSRPFREELRRHPRLQRGGKAVFQRPAGEVWRLGQRAQGCP